MKPKAIVVLSGGQDSTTCLFWAINRWRGEKLHAVTFDYGQRHRIELRAAAEVVRIARGMGAAVDHDFVKVAGDNLLSSSPLVTGDDKALERYKNAKQMDKVIGSRRESTFVPMRNALFLTIAANRAEALGAKDIVTGVCQADNANYDDCRQSFIEATEHYINMALGHDHRGTGAIEIHAPLMYLSKRQTVLLGHKLPGCWEALAYSHTSYDGCYPPTDMNHSNVLRAQGFEEAGLPDPLVLRAVTEGVMKLPSTANYAPYRRQFRSPNRPHNPMKRGR